MAACYSLGNTQVAQCLLHPRSHPSGSLLILGHTQVAACYSLGHTQVAACYSLGHTQVAACYLLGHTQVAQCLLRDYANINVTVTDGRPVFGGSRS